MNPQTPASFLRDLVVRNVTVVLVGREPTTYSMNAVLIDRKGDLARYADPDAWKSGNGDSELAARLCRLHDSLDVVLFTPGSHRGIQAAVELLVRK